jgi:hypothetical protein
MSSRHIRQNTPMVDLIRHGVLDGLFQRIDDLENRLNAMEAPRKTKPTPPRRKPAPAIANRKSQI